ncbi:MAG: hypothetical protein WAN36_14255 [Calditrichia bacterium]
MLYCGIDPSASDHRPSGICLLSEKLEAVYLGKWHTFRELLKILSIFSPESVLAGMDGPLQPPFELNKCCFQENSGCRHRQTTPYKGRQCEQDLIRRGFRCYPSSRTSFAKKWIYRCLQLSELLNEKELTVLEVFPHSTRRLLFPEIKGKKHLAAVRDRLQKRLKQSGIRFPQEEKRYSTDELDAVLAAITVWLHVRNLTQAVGDSREGYIYLPQEKARLPGRESVAAP